MAFFQDFRPAREPMLRAPGSVLVLIAILVVAHVARVLAPGDLPDRILAEYALNPLIYSAQALKQIGVAPPSLTEFSLPLFSHLLLHANLTHLAVNCVWLLAFGPVVARRFGGPAFYLYFLLCGLAGSAAFVALDWGQNVAEIGASGAIAGLMGGAVRMMNIRDPWMNLATLPLAPLFSRQIVLFTLVWLGINLVTGVIGLGLTGSMQAIAWQDHMGGYLAGLVLAGPFDRVVGLEAHLRRTS